VKHIITVSLFVAVFLAGCSAPPQSSNAGSSPGFTIVASFYPLYIMAENVTAGVEGVTVVDLAPPTVGCLHDWSPSTDDFKKLARADIFVTQGAGMEGFLDRVVAGYPHLRIVRLSDGIPLITENGVPNPHTWLNVDYAIAMVQNLASALASADPSHASQYQRNAAAYIAKLAALRDEMIAALKPYAGSEIITFHEAFPYFAQEFGLVIAAVVEREPGSEPSARELADLITMIRQKGIKTVFVEPQYPSQVADTIARETGVRVLTLDPAVTGPPDPDSYLVIMRKNLKSLEEGMR
jgi:zinc transport system substrate-binding protein